VNPIFRPHTLGVDDAPFDKRQAGRVPIIGVAMEGHDVVESIALGEFPVDGDGATDYLASWIAGLRARPMLQAVILGGITIAGLGIIDVTALAERLGVAVLVVTRHNPARSELADALKAAGLTDRLSLLERIPRAYGVGEGLYLAHLVGQAIVLRESRGRV